mgnify:FL=1
MAIQIETLEELEELITKDAKNALMTRGSMSNQIIRDKVVDVTKEMVYDRYEPKNYERRGEQDGLSDEENLTIYLEGKLDKNTYQLSIAQEVDGNFDDNEYSNDLAPTINEGWGDKEQPYEKPSGHLDYLRENLTTGIVGELINALKHDLHMLGYEIK